MLHPHTEIRYVSPQIGYGVFATKKIPKGTITWVMDQLDRIIPREEAKTFTAPNWKNLDKYTYNDRNGNYVFCWDLNRYINHSFEPNSMLTSMNFEIAIKDIEIGDEITNDYGTLNCPETFECAKGPHKGRLHVTPNDLVTFHKIWDEQIAEAMTFVAAVNQPLNDFLTSEQTRKIQDIVTGKMPIPSILDNHWYR
jgi:hypothetical protein